MPRTDLFLEPVLAYEELGAGLDIQLSLGQLLNRFGFNRFGSLRGMVEAPLLALLDVKRLKGAKAAQWLAAMEVARRVAVLTKRGNLQLKGTAAAAECYVRVRIQVAHTPRSLALSQYFAIMTSGRHATCGDESSGTKSLAATSSISTSMA